MGLDGNDSISELLLTKQVGPGNSPTGKVYLWVGADGLVHISNGATDTTLGVANPSFFVHRNGTNQSMPGGAYTKVQFTNKSFDTHNAFDTTNYYFKPLIAGKYQFNAVMRSTGITAGDNIVCAIYKNGAAAYQNLLFPAGSVTASVNASVVLDMNGSTDYAEVFWYGTSAQGIYGNQDYTSFSGCRVGG